MAGSSRKINEMIIPLNRYPHMPYWGTLKEAIVQLNLTYDTGYHTVLVIDENQKLAGLLTQKDIFFKMIPALSAGHNKNEPLTWDHLLDEGTRLRLDLPIKEFMSKPKAFAFLGDGVLKSGHAMLEKNLFFLPVLREDGLVLGVVLMEDVFHEITNEVLNL
jgi:CBS-domain-containing membrane protein